MSSWRGRTRRRQPRSRTDERLRWHCGTLRHCSTLRHSGTATRHIAISVPLLHGRRHRHRHRLAALRAAHLLSHLLSLRIRSTPHSLNHGTIMTLSAQFSAQPTALSRRAQAPHSAPALLQHGTSVAMQRHTALAPVAPRSHSPLAARSDNHPSISRRVEPEPRGACACEACPRPRAPLAACRTYVRLFSVVYILR